MNEDIAVKSSDDMDEEWRGEGERGIEEGSDAKERVLRVSVMAAGKFCHGPRLGHYKWSPRERCRFAVPVVVESRRYVWCRLWERILEEQLPDKLVRLPQCIEAGRAQCPSSEK